MEKKPGGALNGERIGWLDASKGFAAILVVLGHDLRGLLDEDLIRSHVVFWQRIVHLIYSFHMFLFFFLSGYLFFRSFFAHRNGPAVQRKFWTQLGNYCVVYFLFSILFWLARFLLSGFVRIQVEWWDLLRLPLVPMEMYWFLWVLIILFLAGFPILRCFEKRNDRNGYIWIAAAFALSFVSGFLQANRDVESLNKAAFYSAAFFAGAFICKHGSAFLRKKRVFITLLAVSAVVTAAVLCAGWIPSAVPVVSTLIGLLMTLTFLGLFQLLEPRKKTVFRGLEYLGRYALEIYLLQQYVIGVVRRLLVRFALPINALTILLSTSLEVMIPVLTGLLLKKLHLHQPVFRPVTWLAARKARSGTSGE